MLIAALLAVALIPYPVLADQPGTPGCHHGCRGPAQANMQRWTAQLTDVMTNSWVVNQGLSGTSPASGQAYVAVSDGLAAIGLGLSVQAFTENGGKPLWHQELAGFPDGAQIVSVRTWPDEVTVGVVAGTRRTEVILDGATGAITGQHPSALYGGAVGGSERYTVVIAPDAVISYSNLTGKVLWRRAAKGAQEAWRSDGTYLYLAQSAGGYLSGAPVTGLLRIDIGSGAEHQIVPLDGATFAGSLAAAYDTVVLFTSASGTTAYDGTTGLTLWSQSGAVPQGYDPLRRRIYLSSGQSLISVLPRSGRVDSTISGVSGSTYAIRDGIALGLDLLGSEGAAWGYDVAAQRVALAASGLGWPHYFTDLSGVGGSADPSGSMVVIAACGATGSVPLPSGSASASGLASPPPSSSASPSSSSLGSTSSASSSAAASSSPGASPAQPCTKPELVGLAL